MRGLLVGLALLLGSLGCDERRVRVSGEIVYPEYSSGPITVRMSEEQSDSCRVFSCSMRTPGETVDEVVLTGPGPFELEGRVEKDGDVFVLGFAHPDGTEFWDCEAGAMRALSPKDHSGVVIELEPGVCPALE